MLTRARRPDVADDLVGVAALTAFLTLLKLGRGLTFGNGFENLFWPIQIGFLISIALELCALVALSGFLSTSRIVVPAGLESRPRRADQAGPAGPAGGVLDP